MTISATRIDCKKSWTLGYCIGEEEDIDALILIFSFNIQLSLSHLTALYVCSIFNKEGLHRAAFTQKGEMMSRLFQICCKGEGRK